MNSITNQDYASHSVEKLRARYGLLSPEDLKAKRLRCGFSCERADSVFGLAPGSYEKYESGLKLQSCYEDQLIRDTNPFDFNGNVLQW